MKKFTTYDDLRTAVNYLCKVRPCMNADCECCTRIRELLAEKNIVGSIASREFKAQKLPAQIAMRENFQGLCNFCRAELGIDPILCKPHATSKTLSCICLLCLFLILWLAGIAASQYFQYSNVKYFPNQDGYTKYYDFVVDICGFGVESSRPVLRLCWLTTCASTMGMGLPIGVRRFGRDVLDGGTRTNVPWP